MASVLTKGQLRCRGLQLNTSLSLDRITVILTGLAGSVAEDSGWGSIEDEPSSLGTFGRRKITTGKPKIYAESDGDGLPRRMKARYYWWELDAKATKIAGVTDDPGPAMELRAFDFLVAETDQNDVYLILCTTRNMPPLKGYFVRDLHSVLSGEDGGAAISTDFSPIDLVDQDFFFWLMYRYHHDNQLASGLSIGDLGSVTSQDFQHRKASLGDGVTLDRSELLSMIIGGVTDFGPATFSLLHAGLGLSVELTMYVDGGFFPNLNRSSYDEREFRSREVKGPKLVDDLLFTVLPELRVAYNGDTAWAATERAAYINSARQRLAVVLRSLENEAAK